MEYIPYYLAALMQLTAIAGIAAGGGWVWAGILQLPLFAAIDPMLAEDERPRRISNPKLADVPLILAGVLGLFAFAVLAYRFGQGGLTAFEAAGTILSVGWLAVVPGVPVTHELFHRWRPLHRRLGLVLQVQYMDCTRLYVHMFGHHIHLATSRDSDTARRGESIYSFTARALADNYRELYRLEKQSADKRGRSVWSWRGRFVTAIAVFGIFLLGLFVLGGWAGLAAGLVATMIGRVLAEAFNYIQHCGLIRIEGEPISGRHVWNHLAPLTRAAGFEITNHTPHHLDSTVPFHKLIPVHEMRMPSAFLCIAVSLLPPIWNRTILWPRLESWDRQIATPRERTLAREANRKAGWPDWAGEDNGQALAV